MSASDLRLRWQSGKEGSHAEFGSVHRDTAPDDDEVEARAGVMAKAVHFILAHFWGSWQQLQFKFMVQEPPLDWLMSMNQRGFVVYSVACMLNFLIRAIVAYFTGKIIDAWGLAAISFCHYHLKKILQGGDCPIKKHRCLVCIACCCLVINNWSNIWHKDVVYRHRSMGMTAVGWRMLVPFFCLTKKSCAFTVFVGTVSECVSTYTTLTIHAETSGLARVLFLLMIGSLAALAWCCAWISWWATHYNTLKQMEIEMEASQRILAMICDATFWIASDGDTLLSPDHRLEAIFGENLVGKNLSDLLPQTEAQRFHTFLDGAQDIPKSHVSLFPITFVRSQDSSTKLNAELFIVDRRQAFTLVDENALPTRAGTASNSATNRIRGYLIGLRLGPYCEQTLKPMDAALEATRDATTEIAASVAKIASLRCGLPPGNLCLQPGHVHENVDMKFPSGAYKRVEYRILAKEPCDTLEQVSVSKCCVNVGLEMQVLCEISSGCFAPKCVSDLHCGQRVLCMNYNNQELCIDVVQCVSQEPQMVQLDVKLDGFEELVHIPERTRVLSRKLQDGITKWRSLKQVLSGPGMVVQLRSLSEGSAAAKAEASWHEVAQVVRQGKSFTGATVQMRGGFQSAVFVCVGLSKCITLAAHRKVGFQASDDGSSDLCSIASAAPQLIETPTTHLVSEPDSLLSDTASDPSEIRLTPELREQLLQTFPKSFEPTCSYFEHCASALLEDVAKASNFAGQGCCVWHHNLSKLETIVQGMKPLWSCGEPWPPTPAAQQCANCKALLFELEDDGRCWICSEPLS